MRYLIRAIKYLLLLSALYVALVWAMYLLGAEPQIDPWLQIEAHLRADIGKKMVVVFVILAALYPRFGFMRKRIEGYTPERDKERLQNAMALFGYKLAESHDGVDVYRAEGVVKRLTLLWEDRIEVRIEDGALEMKGIRRMVARIAYQLETYIRNSRFED
ncbi:MAG: hypothetical protein IKK89_10320 [Alistipes sp.]|nr:hypothetical protein [Alistipes sp.]MBR6632320.1 hypothetical protein [Alistipes sp.]